MREAPNPTRPRGPRRGLALAILAILASTAGSAAAFQDGPIVEWTVVTPTAVTAEPAVEWTALPDGSWLASGANPDQVRYDFAFELAGTGFSALRFEFLADETLPGGGPGRAANSNFVLTEVEADIQGLGLFGNPEPVRFARTGSDRHQDGRPPVAVVDGDFGADNGYGPEGQKYHEDAQLVVTASKPFGFKSGTLLRVRLHFASHHPQHAAGRIRIAVTTETRTDRLMPAPRGPAADEITASTERGIAFLLAMQQPDGSWLGPDYDLYPVGMTALAIHTLIYCGLRREHPAVRAAAAYVASHDPVRTYDIGCVLMAIKALGEPYPQARVKLLAKRLVETIGNGERGGESQWGYPFAHQYPRDKTNHVDLSNTQYAVLGLRAAAACGERIPPQIYERVARGLIEQQGDYGDFRYTPSSNPTASMVAAGMTVLLVCREELARQKGFDGSVRRIDAALNEAELWMKANWSLAEVIEVPRNPKPYGRWYYYYVYGVERVGSIWNRRLIAAHDWYAEGAAELLRQQADNGGWTTAYGEADANTCFALLFATRASSLTGRRSRKPAEALAPDAAFSIRANREDPLVAWVGDLGPAVLARLAAGERPSAVEWQISGETVARVLPNTEVDPRLDRFTLRHKLFGNGEHPVAAVMRFVGRDGADRGAERSATISCAIDSVETPFHREAIRDAGKNLVLTAIGVPTASTEHEGHPVVRAADGRFGSSWLAAREDTNPTVRIAFKRGPGASVLKLVQAAPYADTPVVWSRAREVEIQLNGNKPARYFMLDDPVRKQRLTFKPTVVKQVRVSVKSRYEGVNEPELVGFREVELYPVAEAGSEEETTLFRGLETVFAAGAEGGEWRVSYTAGSDTDQAWIESEFDDSGFSLATAPFCNDAALGARWTTGDLRLRRAFESVAGDPATYALRLKVDDRCEVWLNGRHAGAVREMTRGGFLGLTLPRSLLREGRNVIAIRAKDLGGVRWLDAELLRYLP
jgi:hypothetical protein